MKARHVAYMAIALALAVTGVVSFSLHLCEAENSAASGENELREVRLANRTIVAPMATDGSGVATLPEMPSTLSGRGTAPFIVVSRGKATRAVRSRITACGARVSGVVPPYGIVVEADEPALNRIVSDGAFLLVEALSAADKISPSLSCAIRTEAKELPVTVVPLSKDDSPVIEEFLAQKSCEIIRTVKSGKGSVRARVPCGIVEEVAGRGDVRWVEFFGQPKPLTDVAVRPGLLNISPVRDTYALSGKGQRVTISDTGIDTGNPNTVMTDFRGRIDNIDTFDGCIGYDKIGHGTHVAGILAGNGAVSGGWFKGVAYEARLNVLQLADAYDNLVIPEPGYLLNVDWRYPSYIHSGSWGGGLVSDYSSWSAEFDGYLWVNTEVLAVFAAGNRLKDGTRPIHEPSGAKNVISVGATENNRPYEDPTADNPSKVAAFSSRGPMRDGRIKPDICAVGTYVASTRSTRTSSEARGLYPGFNRYMYDSGTSMAAPFVSGCAALVRQWIVERRMDQRPTAALIKAVLTGGAYDMSKDADAVCGGPAPNSWQGWGRVDLAQSLYPTNASVMLVDRIAFHDGSSRSFKLTVTNSSPLAVQLVWTDYPAEEGAAKALVNDLDLVVSNCTTSAVWYGNGVEGGDRINTVESVRIPAREMTPGEYCVTVKGVEVVYDSSEGGAAALYVRGAFSEEVHDSWKAESRAEFNIRSYVLLSSNGDYRFKYSEMKAGKGETLCFEVPGSIPGGSETIDVSNLGKTMDFYEGGTSKEMTLQRLGRIEIADHGAESGEPVTNAAGHMATSFSLKVDSDKDILFMFFDEGSTNVATALPTWWYQRYMKGDPLSDIIRFTAVSPECIEWTGGAGTGHILERTASLGAAANWKSVCEYPPAPVLTNYWPVPPEFSTNSFFRIRRIPAER